MVGAIERIGTALPIIAGIVFYQSTTIHPHYDGSQRVADLFKISKAARNLLVNWVREDFLVILDFSKKSRKYGLATGYQFLLS